MTPYNKTILRKADIVIGSYLGTEKELQDARLSRHLKQREILKEQFPKLWIVSLCTCWPTWAKKKLEELSYSSIHQGKHQYKFEDHNLILKLLYKQKNKAVLLLDDDVVPTEIEDLPDQTPVQTLTNWIKKPQSMPCSCLYFSTKGIWADMYYRSRPGGLRLCPVMPSGWATLVRNDLGVLFERKEVLHNGIQLAEDAIFRMKCAAEQKEVLKHFSLFFQTFQNTSSDKGSAWHETRESRRECVKLTREAIKEFWPWLTIPSKSAIRPAWNLVGSRLKAAIQNGLLVKTEHSIIPGPKLKEQYEKDQQMSQRKGLLELL